MGERRSYRVIERGKRFHTVALTDGLWSAEWVSKKRRKAVEKGEAFVAGCRPLPRVVWVPRGPTMAHFLSFAKRR
jgi:hypothetical protein